jgi:hypothetical protein
MRLLRFEPYPLLKGYIQKLWVFESDHRVPDEDLKLIVPNGLAKITIPYKNGVSSFANGRFQLFKETTMTLVGMADAPAIVDVETDGPNGAIGIEFSPFGTYRFFNISQNETTNCVYSLVEVLGNKVKVLQEQVSNAASINERIRLVQQFLLKQLQQQDSDNILDFCLQKIIASKGRVSVKSLEKETGYSSRWLHMKFIQKVGISPKSFSSVIRFQQFYQAWARNNEKHFFQKIFMIFITTNPILSRNLKVYRPGPDKLQSRK